MQQTIYTIEQNLRQFTGTLRYYQHKVDDKEMVLTDGCAYVRHELDLQWIFDMVLQYQEMKSLQLEEFQVWEFKKIAEGKIEVVCSDGNKNNLLELNAMEDLPLDKLTIWFVQGVCMLPSEY